MVTLPRRAATRPDQVFTGPEPGQDVRARAPTRRINRSGQGHGAVVVAVVAVRVVQVTVHQVADVIAMRHRLVAAVRAVNVIRVVA